MNGRQDFDHPLTKCERAFLYACLLISIGLFICLPELEAAKCDPGPLASPATACAKNAGIISLIELIK